METQKVFLKKEQLRIILSGDERFVKLKPERREIILDVLSDKEEEKVFNLKNIEMDIVMDARGRGY